MSGLAAKLNPLIKNLVTQAKPKLRVAAQYAKVELVPPTIGEISQIRSSIGKLIHSAKTGRYRELTVKEAWLNTLVCIEVYCWFFIGECIGKRHLIGYNV
ncbi:ATP synthase subunit g, mitochondrial [Belonocnema kinseyi]|uniref:ATP synthase subunit g, mitochondrial n=1 Tax=Belonocnema kinseyi TaxID=2817044 RepID=UPI00143DA5EA|nr:ATP synthase subunit g, mitochondrial [Belonocnema kinseyi]